MPCPARPTAERRSRRPSIIACSSPARRVRATIIPRHTAPISPEWPPPTWRSPLAGENSRRDANLPGPRRQPISVRSLHRNETPSPAVSDWRKCHQRPLIAPSSSHHAIVLACSSVDDTTVAAAGIFVIAVPSPAGCLIGVATLPAARRTRSRSTVVRGPVPPPVRCLVGIAVLPAVRRTRSRYVLIRGSIPSPARRLVGLALLPRAPRTRCRDVTVCGAIPRPVRCLVGIAVLTAARTTDSRGVALGCAPVVSGGLDTLLLTSRRSRAGAFGIG